MSVELPDALHYAWAWRAANGIRLCWGLSCARFFFSLVTGTTHALCLFFSFIRLLLRKHYTPFLLPSTHDLY